MLEHAMRTSFKYSFDNRMETGPAETTIASENTTNPDAFTISFVTPWAGAELGTRRMPVQGDDHCNESSTTAL